MKYSPPIYCALEKYAQNTLRRFHMPGHGGNIKDSFLSHASRYDVTELSETDNLSCPEGVIKEAQELASKKIGCAKTLFSCGGATLCLQAAIFAALKKRPKGRVFCHRRVHKSVINAFALCDVEPVWITDFDTDLSQCDILVFTWTDYYGNIAPYEKIAPLCEKYGIITVADNAHGAHLAFLNGGKLHPTRHGVDFCVDSLHKTLPVLTGGACLNIKHAQDEEVCRSAMTLFGSTSPNYLIMASIDYALAQTECGELEKTARAIKDIEKKNPEYFVHDSDIGHRDPLRIVLRCEAPRELYNILYAKSIKCEFCDACGVVLIPPYGADSEYFEPLCRQLSLYDEGTYRPERRMQYKIPEKKLSVRQALFMPWESALINDADGRVSAREYSLYPPGIPIILPGEVFTKEIICCLKDSFDTVQILT